MKLCWIVVLVGISIILVFLYSLVAMSSRSERFIEQLMEEEGRKGTDEQDMEAIITEGKERQPVLLIIAIVVLVLIVIAFSAK